MTAFSLPCPADGPLVSVRIGFTAALERDIRRAGRPVLSPLTLFALLDTGAEVSMIEQGLLTPFVREGMKLEAVVGINAPGLGGFTYCPQFMVRFQIVHPSASQRLDLTFAATELIERPLGAPAYQVLIGRDILSRCVFTLDGPAGEFTLTY
jgi:hypothetical protein